MRSEFSPPISKESLFTGRQFPPSFFFLLFFCARDIESREAVKFVQIRRRDLSRSSLFPFFFLFFLIATRCSRRDSHRNLPITFERRYWRSNRHTKSKITYRSSRLPSRASEKKNEKKSHRFLARSSDSNMGEKNLSLRMPFRRHKNLPGDYFGRLENLRDSLVIVPDTHLRHSARRD